MRTDSLRLRIGVIGIATAALTAASVPLAVTAIGYVAKSRETAYVAELGAQRLSRYVYQHGEAWAYHRHRLEALVELPADVGETLRQRVSTREGRAVFALGAELRGPVFTSSAPIVSGDVEVGRLYVEASWRPLLARAAMAALWSVLLGALVYLTLRLLPMRALDRTLAELAARERDLSRKNAEFSAALANMPQGLCMFDAQDRLILCNERYARMYHLTPELARPGARREDILTHRRRCGSAPVAYDDYLAWPTATDDDDAIEIALQDGRVIKVSRMRMAQGGWIASHEDVTALNRARARIDHMAHHDALTDLPNRLLFRELTQTAIAEAKDGVALLTLDLDHFKVVNDTYGHPAGDAVLVQVAERLRACLQPGESLARLGGDEFAALVVGADPARRASALAERIIPTLCEPFEVAGRGVTIGASIGVATAPGDARDFDDLLKAADMALYRAKSEARNGFRFFEPEMDARMQERHQLELDLRSALANGEIEMHYQPLVSLATNRVGALEALMRWRHPTRGQVSPAIFIPLAEEIGLIGRLGAFALQQACTDATAWPDELRVAVNVSAAQFKTGQLALDVAVALSQSGLPGRRLEIEITETAMMEDTDATLRALHALRALGVHVAMDDFGAGYSSLSYLRRFPFDRIKIDQSFVRDLPGRNDAVAIVQAIIGLGRSLGMAVTAEGVETRAQLDRLRAEGCHDVQGWLFSKARPRHEIPALLAQLGDEQAAA